MLRKYDLLPVPCDILLCFKTRRRNQTWTYQWQLFGVLVFILKISECNGRTYYSPLINCIWYRITVYLVCPACDSVLYRSVCDHLRSHDRGGPHMDASPWHRQAVLVIWPGSCVWIRCSIQLDVHHSVHPHEEVWPPAQRQCGLPKQTTNDAHGAPNLKPFHQSSIVFSSVLNMYIAWFIKL